jgi:N-glycosylase/DNA lyase
MRALQELHSIDVEIRERVTHQQEGFRRIWNEGTEAAVFEELVFCLCTPQTKARMAEKAVELLRKENLLHSGAPEKLGQALNIVRFRWNKGKWIVLARECCKRNGEYALRAILQPLQDTRMRRDWLVGNIKGLGFKEASHFLRNVGFGADVAILDRHVLRNLTAFGVLPEEPKNLGPKRYLEIEERMKEWSLRIGIPMDRLDFVLWYKEANDVFK